MTSRSRDAFVLALSLGCAVDDSRPEYLGAPTVPPRPERLDGSAAPVGFPERAGVGGDSEPGLPPLTTLAGTVTVVDLEALDFVGPPSTEVRVLAASTAGGFRVGTTSSDGSFRLEGVQTGPSIWVTVSPGTDSSAALLDTVQAVQRSSSEFASLVVVRRSSLVSLLASIDDGVSLRRGGGHALLRVRDGAGQPVAGARATLPAGLEATLVYDRDEGGFTEAADTTSSRGIALVVNAMVDEQPGTTAAVNVASNGAAATVSFPIVRGGLTIATATLD